MEVIRIYEQIYMDKHKMVKRRGLGKRIRRAFRKAAPYLAGAGTALGVGLATGNPYYGFVGGQAAYGASKSVQRSAQKKNTRQTRLARSHRYA